MSYGRRGGHFGKANPPLSAVGQRRPGAGFQNAQNKHQPPHQQQQNLQAQQQQFQSQLQQQEKARQALQNQPKPVQKPTQQAPMTPKPQPVPTVQQPVAAQKPQPQVVPQKPPQQQPVIVQKPPQQQPVIVIKPPQQAVTQKPPQQQQPPQQQAPQQQAPQQQPQQQQAPQQQPQQQPPPQQQQSNMQQTAEQLLADQSFTNDTKPVINTNSADASSCGDETMVTESTSEGSVQHKPRPFWMKRNGRINRAERAKRRNVRLRKLLQPKNALMIINELVGHVSFELLETKAAGGSFEDMYKASVAIEGKDHVGFGKSKALAKTAAAEAAVRSMILNKLKITSQMPPTPAPTEGASPADTTAPAPTVTAAADITDEEKDMKMEVTEENLDDVSWTHIASFAIHKLFSGWGDDGNMAEMVNISRASSVGSLVESAPSVKEGIAAIQTQPEQKPAKKLPDNAAMMNPIMLLNQMHPSAKYEEMGKTGTPPHIEFTIKCTVDNQAFVGTGPNKKAARKQATFEACKTLLGIQYPPDILQGTSPTKTTAMEVA